MCISRLNPHTHPLLRFGAQVFQLYAAGQTLLDYWILVAEVIFTRRTLTVPKTALVL